MKALYERGKIRENDLKQFLASFQTAVREAENYLLNVHRILLKPEYIFYEDDRFISVIIRRRIRICGRSSIF